MKILDLYGENIYSYKKMEIDFSQYAGGVTLILGRNLDQKTSNGSGKTTVLKTLYFLYYGEDLQGLNKEFVKNREIEDGYYVRGSFEDRGNLFLIERFDGRKDKHRSGKGLNLFVNGKLLAEGSELGYSEVQKIITSKLRMSSRLFLSAVLSVQNDSKNFLLSNDTEKKELLSELLDLQAYAKAFDFIKKEISKIEEEVESKNLKIINIEETIKLLDEQVKDLVVKRDSFKIENKNNLQNEEDNLKIEKNKKLDLESKVLNNFDLDKIKLSIDELKKANLEINKQVSIEPKIVETLLKIKLELDQNESKIKELSFLIDSNVKEIESLDSISLDFTIEDQILKMEQEIQNKKEKKDQLTKDVNDLEIAKMQLKSELSLHDQELSNLNEKIDELQSSDTCPTCERPFDKDHKSHILMKIKDLEMKKNKTIEAKEKTTTEISNAEKTILLKKSEITGFSSLSDDEKNVSSQKMKFLLEKQKFELKEEQKQQIISKNIESAKVIEEKIKRNLFLKEKESPLTEKQSQILELKKISGENEDQLIKLNQSLMHAEIESNRNQQLKERIKETDDVITSILSKIVTLKETVNPYGGMISELDIKISGQLERVHKLTKDVNAEMETLKYYNFWQIGFAPTGIRSFITDDVIELLNRKVQDNLNDLFDGAISIVFDPETKKKGVVSNKISTNCYLNGKEAPVLSLSTGEQRRAILATDLALTEVAEARSGTKLNIRFLDEPMNGIDSHGQIPALRLFSRLSKDKDGFFVISHDESFQSMCPTTLFVLKKDQVSRIVSKEEFNRADYSADDMDEIPIKSTRGLDSSESGKSKKELLAERIKEIEKQKKDK